MMGDATRLCCPVQLEAGKLPKMVGEGGGQTSLPSEALADLSCGGGGCGVGGSGAPPGGRVADCHGVAAEEPTSTAVAP